VPAVEDNNGYHSEIAKAADAGKWVVIDLGEKQKIDAIRLSPARPIDFTRDAPGFMFPVRFKVEASDSPEFAGAKVVIDKTGADEANPGWIRGGIRSSRSRHGMSSWATKLGAAIPGSSGWRWPRWSAVRG